MLVGWLVQPAFFNARLEFEPNKTDTFEPYLLESDVLRFKIKHTDGALARRQSQGEISALDFEISLLSCDFLPKSDSNGKIRGVGIILSSVTPPEEPKPAAMAQQPIFHADLDRLGRNRPKLNRPLKFRFSANSSLVESSPNGAQSQCQN